MSYKLAIKDNVKQSLLQFYQDEDLESILCALATPCTMTSLRVNTLVTSREQALKELNKQLKEYSFKSHPTLPDAIIYESTINDVKPSHPRVFVGSKCGISVLSGAEVYAVGILGMDKDVVKGSVVSVYFVPDNKIQRGMYTDSIDQGIFVGNGICLHSRSVMINLKEGLGIQMTQRIFVHPPLNGIMVEQLFLQNIPSMIVSHALDPQPGESILDMCAAPGGKTTHIATLMKNSGKIIAIDRNRTRVQMLKKNCERYNLTCVECIKKDSATLMKDWEPETFDRILLDPPCSGLGNRPQFDTSEIDNSVFEMFNVYQQKLFENAVYLLKKNGVLVYSTCTINPLENECNVKWALEKYSDILELVEQRPYLGKEGIESSGLDESSRKKVQFFDPSIHGTIGFFIAKFRKKASVN